jgi:ADP-heptose:LPS heptosyltransferase
MKILAERGLTGRFIVINPGGGVNPGTTMREKRWPTAEFAKLINKISPHVGLSHVVLVTSEQEAALAGDVAIRLRGVSTTNLAGKLTIPEIGALASLARAYIGNDTGLTHFAAAAGAATIMVMGPTDPLRYSPFSPNALALWKEYEISTRGVADGAPESWDWAKDGITADAAADQVASFIGGSFYNLRNPILLPS